MSEIPKTDSVDVAKVAVAWEITKMSVMGTDEYIAGGGPEKREMLVDAFGGVYKLLGVENLARSSGAGQPARVRQPAQARAVEDGGIMDIRNSFSDP